MAAPLTQCGVRASVKHGASPQNQGVVVVVVEAGGGGLLAAHSPALFVAFESLQQFEASLKP